MTYCPYQNARCASNFFNYTIHQGLIMTDDGSDAVPRSFTILSGFHVQSIQQFHKQFFFRANFRLVQNQHGSSKNAHTMT